MSEFAKAAIRREVEKLVEDGAAWEVVFSCLIRVAVEMCEGQPSGINALDAGAGAIREAADRSAKGEGRLCPKGFVW